MRPLRGMVVGFLLGVMGASGGVHAASGRTIGCAAQGYTMQIPAIPAWVIKGNCTKQLQGGSPDGQVGLIINVIKESSWNEAASRTLINLFTKNIATKLHSPLDGATTFHHSTLRGHTFVEGINWVTAPAGHHVLSVIEMTYVSGRVFSFHLLTDGGSDSKNIALAAGLVASIRMLAK